MASSGGTSDGLGVRLARIISFSVVLQLVLMPIVMDFSDAVLVGDSLGGRELVVVTGLAIVLAVSIEQFRPVIATDTVWKFCLATLAFYHVLRAVVISSSIRTGGSIYYPLLVGTVVIGAMAAGFLVATVRLRELVPGR
ncbi:hypothetical protein [Halocatena halophila]|uniref:hypothetical protein n=1 Tax=Halocatena halophila TaxID=2814576 RepID=UPI002ED3CF9B